MKLSSRGDYAVRVVLELAEAGPRALLSGKDLGVRVGVPPNYVPHLLRDLQVRGIIHAVRGPKGGFSLGRAPADITVGEVVRAMDGPLAPIACASVTVHVPCPTTRCESESECVLRDLWVSVRNAIADIVDSTSFADLMARRASLPAAERAAYRI
jgi:Rrf2 family protein